MYTCPYHIRIAALFTSDLETRRPVLSLHRCLPDLLAFLSKPYVVYAQEDNLGPQETSG